MAAMEAAVSVVGETVGAEEKVVATAVRKEGVEFAGKLGVAAMVASAKVVVETVVVESVVVEKVGGGGEGGGRAKGGALMVEAGAAGAREVGMTAGGGRWWWRGRQDTAHYAHCIQLHTAHYLHCMHLGRQQWSFIDDIEQFIV